MNNEYRVLWFDDNAKSQKAFSKRLKSQLGKLGFGLSVEYHQAIDKAMIVSLCERMRVYNEFDLIMFDHKLEGAARGAKFAAEFRKNKIYTDMVYYSSSDVETLWTALRREKVDGVYVLNREGMDNDLIQIVQEQVARVFDVSNMRGYILQFMSQVEGALRLSLADDAKSGDDIGERIAESIRSDEISVAKKRIKKMEQLTLAKCINHIIDGNITFDRVRSVMAKIRTENENRLGEQSLLCKMQRLRNVFAHRRHRVDKDNHRLYLEGDKTHPDGYSFDDFTRIRIDLMKLAGELQPITGDL